MRGVLAGTLSVLLTADVCAAAMTRSPTAPATPNDIRIPLSLDLPKPRFVGTPKHAPEGTTVDMKPRKGRREAPQVPPATRNLARDRPVSASDPEPIIGELALVTDGDKEATDGSYVELSPGFQHVQIDLGTGSEIFVVVVWHYHGEPRVYHDVAIRVSNDPDFIEGVVEVFNNDQDNSAGLGVGKDREYFETFEGLMVETGAVQGRYVRLTSRGCTADEMNRYTEVEVYGRPLK